MPLLLGDMCRQMLRPSRHVVRSHGIPPAVIREAFTENAEHRTLVRESLAGVREFCVELGLVPMWTRPIWRRLGIGAD